ncbi:MAG: ABC transporter ATP-binding protein [Oscillospiraceae bacterium]|nr:ABC transporter ATP-binding protein [Oscillospiraceae bacterium]
MSKIELQELTKKYRLKLALDSVSLTLEKGHIYGLLGRNGAGKTTLCSLIANRDFPTSGKVLLDGEKLKENDALLKKVYCMGAEDLLPNYMRVRDVIASMKYFYLKSAANYALSLCDQFRLDPKKRLSQLSTGYRTIAKVIFAMSSGADFIFLDEPTLGLDANHRELLYKLILERFEETGAAFVISTHLIDECAGLFERCFVLREGKLIADEDSDTLRRSAYAVEGKTEAVDAYCQGREVLSRSAVGTLCSACVKGEPDDAIPAGLEISQPGLQQLLIALTGGEG